MVFRSFHCRSYIPRGGAAEDILPWISCTYDNPRTKYSEMPLFTLQSLSAILEFLVR